MRKTFFRLPDGREAGLYEMCLPDGFSASVTDFGCCVVSLQVPDAGGGLRDVALGWKDPGMYFANPAHLGAVIGRVPNRISGGRFVLDGMTYQMCLNGNGICTLHGGFGYSHRLWEVENATPTMVTFTLRSPDGDAGFPGNLFIRTCYRLLADHTLEMDISAESDRPTVADFTNHTYFNLAGESAGENAEHRIIIDADEILETDADLLPTGRILDVTGSRFDLRKGKSFREIFAEHAPGMDNTFILSHRDHCYRENVAVVTSPESGIRMAIHTSRPGVLFYTANFLSGPGKHGEYRRHGGFCLETQGWPDAVNHPEFPSIRVEPGRPFHGITRYAFGTVAGA